MARTTCLTPVELAAFQLGDLPETVLDDVAAHLETCDRCQEMLSSPSGSDLLLHAIRDPAQRDFVEMIKGAGERGAVSTSSIPIPSRHRRKSSP